MAGFKKEKKKPLGGSLASLVLDLPKGGLFAVDFYDTVFRCLGGPRFGLHFTGFTGFKFFRGFARAAGLCASVSPRQIFVTDRLTGRPRTLKETAGYKKTSSNSTVKCQSDVSKGREDATSLALTPTRLSRHVASDA